MKTVVVSIYFTSDELGTAFASGVSQMLLGMGIEAAPEQSDNHITLIGHEIQSLKQDPAHVDVEPEELIVAISAPPEEVKDSPTTGEVIVKSLSSATPIPFRIDKDVKCSELMVKNLAKEQDQVKFDYCENSYKFPLASKDDKIENKDPEFTDTSIRVVIEMNGKAMPVLFKLVDTTGDPRAIFGADLFDKVK